MLHSVYLIPLCEFNVFCLAISFYSLLFLVLYCVFSIFISLLNCYLFMVTWVFFKTCVGFCEFSNFLLFCTSPINIDSQSSVFWLILLLWPVIHSYFLLWYTDWLNVSRFLFWIDSPYISVFVHVSSFDCAFLYWCMWSLFYIYYFLPMDK